MSRKRQGSREQTCKPKEPDCGPRKKTCVDPREAKKAKIEDYRRCPLCFHGKGGHGVTYSTNGRTRYYRCCQRVDREGLVIKEGCGHTWTKKFDPAVVMPDVEHRDVDLSTR